LMGLEGCIIKVNRRKRRAKIRLDMNDSPILFDLGFEILEKLQEKNP
jgi:transcription termination/antitermination protein NusG